MPPTGSALSKPQFLTSGRKTPRTPRPRPPHNRLCPLPLFSLKEIPDSLPPFHAIKSPKLRPDCQPEKLGKIGLGERAPFYVRTRDSPSPPRRCRPPGRKEIPCPLQTPALSRLTGRWRRPGMGRGIRAGVETCDAMAGHPGGSAGYRGPVAYRPPACGWGKVHRVISCNER